MLGNFKSYFVVACTAFISLSAAAQAGPFNSNGARIALSKKGPAINEPVVTLETSKGIIKIAVYRKETPVTASNFIDLVQKNFYNGLSFHRHEPGFVIQGGDPLGNGTGGYVDPKTRVERRIPLETSPNLRHSEAGMVAMARSSDPNSASSQFYITLAPCTALDGNYAVFGKVIDGMQIVTSLRKGDKIIKATVQEPGAK